MLKRLVEHLTFSRTLTVVLLANISCMVLCNLLRAPVWIVEVVFPICFLGGWMLIRRGRFRRPSVSVSRGMVIAVVVVVVALAAVRSSYVLEWLPGNTVHVLLDDHARIAELVSMTLSNGYPLVSPVSQGFLFSFYYAALYPMVFLKLLIPVLTLKDTIFLGCLGYDCLILLSLLEISVSLLPSRLAVWVFQYFVLAFSGLDWLMDIAVNGAPVLAHHEWWQLGAPFHANAQITAFPTALLFAVHHVAAAMSCLLAWMMWWRASFPNRALKLLVVGLLLVNAFYSSVFVALGCLPFLLVEWRTLARRYFKSPVLLLLVFVWIVPLFLFLHKLPGQRFILATSRLGLSPTFWLDKILSSPAWLLVVPVVEFAGVPLLLAASWGELAPKERLYFTAAILFFLSTYLVAFTANNNYSMRGLLVPTIVLFLLCARHFDGVVRSLQPRLARVALSALVVVALVFSFGNLLEFTGHMRRSLLSMELTWRLVKGQTAAEKRFPVDYRDLARSRGTRFYDPHPGESSRLYFNAEKRVELRFEDMDRWERELLRYPCRGWVYCLGSSWGGE